MKLVCPKYPIRLGFHEVPIGHNTNRLVCGQPLPAGAGASPELPTLTLAAGLRVFACLPPKGMQK